MDFATYPLYKELSKLNKKSKKEALLMAHIRAENNNDGNVYFPVDEYHSLIFKGYSTTRGYNHRFKKYDTDANIPYPYGTGMVGAAIIMATIGCPKLAMMEAKLICSHPQSLMAADALISLMENKNINKMLQIVDTDKELSKVCRGEVSFKKTNLDFLPLWCRHYLLVAVEAYLDHSLYGQMSVRPNRTQCLIYCIVHEAFHPPSLGSIAHQFPPPRHSDPPVDSQD